MLYVLFGITLVFLILNFMITQGDYLHPSTLFCEIFALYELTCIIGQSTYQITLHAETVYVMTCGFLAFTIGGILTNSSKSKTIKSACVSQNQSVPYQYIHISNYLVYALIIMQIITQFFFIKYLKAIATAWGSGGGSLGEMINLYDTMTKFWVTIFSNLNVTIPMVYRLLNPITSAGAWIILYVAVNNFMVNRKVKFSHIIVVILLCTSIMLNGSRSPLLRVVTFVIIMIYILNYKKYRYRKGNFKFFFKLLFVMLCVSGLMIALLYLMGRSEKMTNVWRYIFTYTGAPIVNLDNFLQNNSIKMIGGNTTFWGEHTFYKGYAYLAKLLNLSFTNQIQKIGGFVTSNNGIEIGNVYTTYNVFAYDFGYLGIFPIIFVVALYYTKTYKKVLQKKQLSKTIDFELFIYAYLFNDLVMLPFSNRFYDTVFDAPFIKMIIIAWIIRYALLYNKKMKISFGKRKLKVKL